MATTGVPEFLQEGFYSALKNYKPIVKDVKKNLKLSRDYVYRTNRRLEQNTNTKKQNQLFTIFLKK